MNMFLIQTKILLISFPLPTDTFSIILWQNYGDSKCAVSNLYDKRQAPFRGLREAWRLVACDIYGH